MKGVNKTVARRVLSKAETLFSVFRGNVGPSPHPPAKYGLAHMFLREKNLRFRLISPELIPDRMEKISQILRNQATCALLPHQCSPSPCSITQFLDVL